MSDDQAGCRLKNPQCLVSLIEYVLHYAPVLMGPVLLPLLMVGHCASQHVSLLPPRKRRRVPRRSRRRPCPLLPPLSRASCIPGVTTVRKIFFRGNYHSVEKKPPSGNEHRFEYLVLRINYYSVLFHEMDVNDFEGNLSRFVRENEWRSGLVYAHPGARVSLHAVPGFIFCWSCSTLILLFFTI